MNSGLALSRTFFVSLRRSLNMARSNDQALYRTDYRGSNEYQNTIILVSGNLHKDNVLTKWA